MNLIEQLSNSGTELHGDVVVTDIRTTARTFPTLPTPRRTRPTLPPYTPPPEVYSAITFTSQNIYVVLQTWNIRNGGSASFRFQTVEPQGLLFFNGGSPASSIFIAVEVYDGKLYLVYNFGGITKRVMFSEQSVDDGQQHRVSITINHRYIELDLDGQRRRIELQQISSGRAANMDMVTPLFVGGVLRYDTLPWHLWTRRGFQGCLEDLVINGNGINLDRLSTEQFLTGIARQCTQLSGSCLNQPCYTGVCSDRMDGYKCDCTGTAYTGDTCHTGKSNISLYLDVHIITFASGGRCEGIAIVSYVCLSYECCVKLLI